MSVIQGRFPSPLSVQSRCFLPIDESDGDCLRAVTYQPNGFESTVQTYLTGHAEIVFSYSPQRVIFQVSMVFGGIASVIIRIGLILFMFYLKLILLLFYSLIIPLVLLDDFQARPWIVFQ